MPGFIAGTVVHTKDGLKPIEEILVGDWVLSFADDMVPPSRAREDHELTYREVTKTSALDDVSVSQLTFSSLGSRGAETIGLATDQLIYDKHRGWMPASSFSFGGGLENWMFGNLLTLKNNARGEKARVYSIEVGEFHTCYVGKGGAWVHT